MPTDDPPGWYPFVFKRVVFDICELNMTTPLLEDS